MKAVPKLFCILFLFFFVSAAFAQSSEPLPFTLKPLGVVSMTSAAAGTTTARRVQRTKGVKSLMSVLLHASNWRLYAPEPAASRSRGCSAELAMPGVNYAF